MFRVINFLPRVIMAKQFNQTKVRLQKKQPFRPVQYRMILSYQLELLYTGCFAFVRTFHTKTDERGPFRNLQLVPRDDQNNLCSDIFADLFKLSHDVTQGNLKIHPQVDYQKLPES